jgi:putative ABC transport system permease protein
MRLVEGRDLTESECLGGAPVALINETAAKLWPHALDPIGQELLLRSLSANPTESWAATARHLRVVGVVADTHNESLTEPVPPAAFVPYSLTGMRHTTLIAKTVGEPGSVLNGLRARLQTLDPTRPLARPLAPAEIMEMQIAPRRFSMTLFSVLAGLSLCLAAVGIYSVISYSVSQRTREIGVRMALGAQPSDILNLVIADGSRLLLAGLAVGCGVSFLLSNVVRSQLFIITEPEPTLFAGALLTLVVIVLFACYLPSRRATGVDPIAALRSE